MFPIIKDTAWYIFGEFITKGLGFFAIVFYTHYLSQSEIGSYGYILIIISFANTFLILGVDNAYARYFFEAKSYMEKQILTSTLFIFLIVWTLCILVVPIIFVKEIAYKLLETHEYDVVLLLAFLSLSCKLLSTMSNQVLRNQFKTKQFIVINFLSAAITLGSSLLLLHVTFLGSSAIFIGMIISDLALFPIRFYYIKDLLINQFDFYSLKKLLVYGIPFFPVSVAYWIFSSTDRIMIESMSGLDSVGLYTVAVSLSAVMTLISSAIGQAWSPHAIKIYEEDHNKAKVLYQRFFYLLIGIVLFIVFGVGMLGKELITMCFPEGYQKIFYPLVFLLIGMGFQVTTQVTALGIGFAKKTHYIIYVTSFIACLNIILNYILIPIYDVLGASIATACSFLTLTCLYGKISHSFFPIDYNMKILFLSFLGLICILLGSYLLPMYIRFTLFIIIFMSIVLSGKLILKALK